VSAQNNTFTLSKKNADRFVPDHQPETDALQRTTHLAIGAHQDDLEILAYNGIAECLNNNSQWFTGVVVSDGAGSPRAGPYAGVSDEEMVTIRRQEQRKAAALGQYSIQYQLGYSSKEIKDAASARSIEDDLLKILKAARPEVVYLHNPADRHDTHVSVFLRSLASLRALPVEIRPKKVWGCEVWRDLDWLSDHDKISLAASKYPEVALGLCSIFDSQISGGKRYDLAAQGRRLAHATFSSSHETDKETGLILAMDIMPLVENENLSVAEYVSSMIRRFEADVCIRLGKY
jgi:LmbE family N-acetylglucosaminyl deacetylase